jgi:chitinase
VRALLFLAAGISACAAAVTACAGSDDADLSVAGWYASWRTDPDSVALSGVDDVFYAFALPTAAGGLDTIPAPDRLRALVARGARDGFRVHLSIGGWNDGDDAAFEVLADDPARRRAFADAAVDVVGEFGLDGIDIDWEHPDPGPSARNYAALVAVLADALRPIGASLSVSVAGSWAGGGGAILPEVFERADRIHVMAYAGGYGPDHASFRYARSAIDTYLDMGAPPRKLFLGIPFFALNEAGDALQYREVAGESDGALAGDRYGDYFYNGEATLRAKVRLAATEGLGGLIAWDLTADAPGPGALLPVLLDEAR